MNVAEPRARSLPVVARRDLLLVALTVSSGAVDAISFLALGKVFTAFMTGNFVFVGLVAAGAPGPALWRVAVALAAFSAGVVVSAGLTKRAGSLYVWPRRVTVALAVSLIPQAGFLAVWATSNGRPSSAAAGVLLALSGLAMGMQSGAILALRVTGVFTTAATATAIVLMRDLASLSHSGTGTEPRRLAGVLAGLLAGATAGGMLLVHARAFAPLLPLATTMLVVAAAPRDRNGRERSGS